MRTSDHFHENTPELSPLFAVAAAGCIGLVMYMAVAGNDHSGYRETKTQNLRTISTQPGSLYESVGKTSGGCTITYRGDGVATSAAHCFDDLVAGELSDRYVKFHCDETVGDGSDCSSVEIVSTPSAVITEVAIPARYYAGDDHFLPEKSEGYDIAYVRLAPVEGAVFPAANFPLNDRIAALSGSQAGYNYTAPGLTGDPSCMISPSSLGHYVIKTNCYAVEGSSGSDLLDEDNRMIGVMSTSGVASGGYSYATPLTPGLKAVFEKFRNGTLEGESSIHDHWRGPLKITRFSYERTPVVIPSDPCC